MKKIKSKKSAISKKQAVLLRNALIDAILKKLVN